MAGLGYLPKLKTGSGTSLWCTFYAWFFHKNVPCLILYLWTKFQYTFFPFQDIKQNVLLSCVIKFLFRQLTTSETLRFIFDHPLQAMPYREKKKGRMEMQKYEYLENEKSFLNEIKTIFHFFWRAIIWWKNKKWWTQALRVFLNLAYNFCLWALVFILNLWVSINYFLDLLANFIHVSSLCYHGSDAQRMKSCSHKHVSNYPKKCI